VVDFKTASQKVIALLFFEPSTRTRFSFEMAAARLGLRTLTLDSAASTSLAKGESIPDTIDNIAAMGPDAIVTRHSGALEVSRTLQALKIPVLNAGDGTDEHPTQALLDAFTLRQRRKTLKGEKILFVGDVAYSRVARSDLLLFQRLGLDVGICGPEGLMPNSDAKEWAKVRQFTSLAEGLGWCDSVMGLRLQQERHAENAFFELESYIANYRLDPVSLQHLKKDGIIMHPGPFVPEVDLATDVLTDPRCVIHEQVSNGVFTRMALLALTLGLWGKA
jgi:aspartate carbamoyltransferase catalytic subunit